ncbi:transposase [Hymenobacter sp. YC55]|uniref:transposase n=1 Tax=Hymenobacter sp. YC55 TaxID=3034019 RepID=UPI0023F9A18B|nr:transposase [Hymenobacter sp. YC55]MDF7815385.1 transposase [Hymenobacter sp. YC55]
MTQKTNTGAPRKRRHYDVAFRADTLRLASESRSTQAAARQLGISSKLLYKWQKALQPEVRRLQQERDILKKALAIFTQPTP